MLRSAGRFSRIPVRHPIVDMSGDEMANVLRESVQSMLVFPYVDLQNRQHFDLSLGNRDRTKDAVTDEALRAIIDCKVAVKASMITPDKATTARLGLLQQWPSASGKLRERQLS